MQEHNLPDFSEKLVVSYVSNAPGGIENGIVMEFVSFVEYGGRLFLTGRMPQADSDVTEWASNLQAAISWDDVVYYIMFNSREEFLSRMRGEARSWFRRFFGG